MKKGATIYVTGTVQGVGFRPFVYSIALRHHLAGIVTNLGDASVEIRVEGEESNIHTFLDDLKRTAPEVSEIREIRVEWHPYQSRYSEFRIVKSRKKRVVPGSMIPPDMAICSECVSDILTPGSRWHNYSFTCCSRCGPRFTAVQRLPYDRSSTNMNPFPLCQDCRKEYDDPKDRRFHAQGICCPQCGPRMALYDGDGKAIQEEDPFEVAAKLLEEGWILAVKGIGGVHLAVRTTVDDFLKRLRMRKNRPKQPLAVMSPSIETVKSYAIVAPEEEELLASWRKPIVLLTKSQDYHLSDLVSPGLNTVGVMLPYTGIHFLLFRHTREPALVMTSGNKPGLPMAITNDEAFKMLEGIADYFLLYDREIINRCDDSVVRLIDGVTAFIRRSRGYTPTPIEVPIPSTNDVTILALGAELRNTGCILHKNKCYITQYIGDTDNLETLNYLDKSLNHMKSLLKITSDADVISCDTHPRYLTSRLGQEMAQDLDAQLIRVQHHHAHIASLMAENGVPPDQPVIGIALDGVGYGPDGTIWGGEVLEVTYRGYERCGHLRLQPMPGGDLCSHYPLRMLIAVLSTAFSMDEIRDITLRHISHGLRQGQRELDVVLEQLRRGDMPITSSTGRIIDAVSAMMGLCYRRTYEGEPAIRLEAEAEKGDASKIKINPKIYRDNGELILDTSELIRELIEVVKHHNAPDVCAAFQRTLATGIADIATQVANDRGIDVVGLSGGVAVNRGIYRDIKQVVESNGLCMIHHSMVPPGDGGISLGQCVTSILNM
ncbi:MAG: carbamoyltransferase HypF [Candidatus Bathyarchaeia archaeon]